MLIARVRRSRQVKCSQVTLAHVAHAALAVVTVGIVVQRLTRTRPRPTPSAPNPESEFAIKKPPQRKSSRTGAFQARSTDVERRIVKPGANRRRGTLRDGPPEQRGHLWSLACCPLEPLSTGSPSSALPRNNPHAPAPSGTPELGPPPLGERESPHRGAAYIYSSQTPPVEPP
ncbi:hypothetical protein HETIRDRAFT_449543 [Heterobasidion irregulare TC 32-1]|uniref:Uncharacterized protein n=1 Tax=Heterobasidion irregulare (strain TC 32-1) TaxID=747525 RepID=W4KDK5_HETIT|nr:uncharacterized protein HETIRDRAFT_449543 [Heterobasidion irregulare TC 32-1]ETW83937.1 hypothetical protein HETIRDRAFT_449543 [Heterobasidion irregulare TC 32-1]